LSAINSMNTFVMGLLIKRCAAVMAYATDVTVNRSASLTRFLHANRFPPRIKSGAGFRWKTLGLKFPSRCAIFGQRAIRQRFGQMPAADFFRSHC
jgi:hypothetical protein